MRAALAGPLIALGLATGLLAQGGGGDLTFGPGFDDIVRAQGGDPSRPGGPLGPGAGLPAGVPMSPAGLSPLLAALDASLDPVLRMQRDVLGKIAQHRLVQDPKVRADLVNAVRLVSYGIDPARPQPPTIEGVLGSAQVRDLEARLRQVDPTWATLDFHYMRVMGEGGKLATVRAAQETIRRFLVENAAVPSPYASVPPPARPPAPPTPAPPATLASEQASIQARLTEVINRRLSGTGLTGEERDRLVGEERRLAARMKELAAAQAKAAGAPPVTAAVPRAPQPWVGPATAGVGTVSNRYGINPPVLTDEEIRAILDPLIARELADMNTKLSRQGLRMNAQMQVTGTTSTSRIKAVGKPAFDHHAAWMDKVPAMRQAVERAARERAGARTGPPAPAGGDPAAAARTP